jgi:1-deoxy-D-xylulose-5-phosphate reductoisomerase
VRRSSRHFLLRQSRGVVFSLHADVYSVFTAVPLRFAVMRKRRVVILGSTGSIGESALKVARDIPERMEVVGLAAGRNAARLAEQVREFRPRLASLAEPGDVAVDCELMHGDEGLCELARMPEADLVLIAIVGTAGLRPALAAIESGKDIAVASKEILVMAGEAVMTAAREHGVQVLPVDSEHNAIFQCLEGRSSEQVRRIILTASGGPFRTWPAADLEGVTLEQALKHPTWTMGSKITIDSATLFNKGLEMIEARWLFDVEMGRVDVIVHPQSIVHSMVEFADNSILAQLSATDMCFPIQYAVTWPERVPNRLPPLNFATLGSLSFEEPRRADFPALDLARWAGEAGGTLPAVLNAANEVAVATFSERRCGFPAIWRTVERVMKDHALIPHASLEEILAADAWARVRAGEVLRG